MNIYTLPSAMIKVTEKSLRNGKDSERGLVKKYLELDKEYELLYTEVHKYHTKVYLKEWGRMLAFNSSNFENVKPQSKTDDKKHPQWKHFNA